MYEVQKNLEIIANMLYRILLLKHALHILSQTDFYAVTVKIYFQRP